MLRIAVLLVLALPLAGCQLAVPFAATQVALPLATSQTVLRGTKQLVEIRTEPPGATVNIAGYGTRTTPASIMLARGHSHTVRIVKEGFKPVTTDVLSQRADADAGGGSVIGGALDEASGAAWELNPSRLTVTLESLTANNDKAAVAAAGPRPAASPQATTETAAASPATPPIVPRESAPGATGVSAALSDQLARLDRLLEQRIITAREHEILTAAAISAAAVAGVTPAQ